MFASDWMVRLGCGVLLFITAADTSKWGGMTGKITTFKLGHPVFDGGI